MPSRPAKENRKSPRVEISQGVWVSWHASGPRNVSRVRDLSAGGVFIHTDKPVAIGTAVKLLFALPEGEIRTDGVVCYADSKKGIGVEFTRMGAADRARLQALLRRLNR
jgi:uncharacterized protein (TIGR02266 family)